jgi:hypothetical protein
MAIASLSPLTHLFAPVHALLAWLAGPRPVLAPPATVRAVAPRVVVSAPAKPLRVVRVLDPQAPRAGAGRMVISGRLADVCAELDRLAALEARGC